MVEKSIPSTKSESVLVNKKFFSKNLYLTFLSNIEKMKTTIP